MAISSKNNSNQYTSGSIQPESIIGNQIHRIRICIDTDELKTAIGDLSMTSLLHVDGTMYINPDKGELFVLSNSNRNGDI